MQLFYSTCPAGLEGAAAEMAAVQLKSFALKQKLSGALIYASKGDTPELPCFHNTYLLISRYDTCKTPEQASKLFLGDRRAADYAQSAMLQRGFSTFRVMFSKENTLAKVDPKVRLVIERYFRAVEVNRETPQTELTFLTRSEGFSFVLLRLTGGGKRREVKAGELSPAIVSTMLFLAQPEKKEVFLDPFAGSGAIGRARMKLGGASRVVLCDSSEKKASAMRKSLSQCEVKCCDSLALGDHFAPGEVNAIVSDPPWGIYEPLPMPASEFYARMLASFGEVLAPYASVVLLTAEKKGMEQALDGDRRFSLRGRYDILVNGKKAAIFKLKFVTE